MINFEKKAWELVIQKMKEKGWSRTVLAGKMNLDPSSISKLLSHETIKLNRLMEFSEVFGFNFLRVLADLSEINHPPTLLDDHSACQLRYRELQIENATLLKVLGK